MINPLQLVGLKDCTKIDTQGYICHKHYMDDGALRDHFAGLAMQCYIRAYEMGEGSDDKADCAKSAYDFAEAMLEERAKRMETNK